ncbi:MAG: tetratricopeptide repeat protein [Myxococcota bacterium]
MTRMTWFLVLALGGCDALEGLVEGGAEQASAASTAVTVTTSSDEAREAYASGMVALDNFRTAEAIFDFERALELDPDFARAKAQLGSLELGEDGLVMLRAANEAAATLPEAERILIRSLLADAQGQEAEANTLLAKVGELAPGDWRVQMQLGTAAFFQEDYAAALTRLQTATELAPDAGPAWNVLGYTQAQMGDTDAAVASFDRYIAVAPDEANPYDSKGEVLLQAGRFEESEEAFLRATRVAPSFYQGWYGVAQTRFMRGDWDGGLDAVAKGGKAATRPVDKLGARTVRAWALTAMGNRLAAEATVTAAAEEAKAGGLDDTYAFMSLTHGQLLMRMGEWDDATAAFDEALRRLGEVGLEGRPAEVLRNQTALGKAHAAARKGEIDVARKALDELSAKRKAQPWLKNSLTHLHGVIDVAGGYFDEAIATLAMCPNVAFDCRHDLAKAQAAAGKDADAASTLASLRARPWRQASFLPVWTAIGTGEPDTTAAKE